jgi:hypothetical protein
MRNLAARSSIGAAMAAVAIGCLIQSASAAGPPVVYTVGISPAGAGYLDCYAPAVGGANPGTPIGGYAGGATTLAAPEGVTASRATGLFYATDRGANAVDEFKFACPHPIANVAPGRLVGLATGLAQPVGIAIDLKNNVEYVSNFSANTVAMFPLGALGNVPPICVLGGPLTLLNGPAEIAVEPAIAGATHVGWIYVANFTGGDVTVYHPGACGNVAPAHMIKGALTKLVHPWGIDVFKSGNPNVPGPAIFVGDPAAKQVLVFPDAGPVNIPPIQDLGGAASTLKCPSSVRVSKVTQLTYVEDPCALNVGRPKGRIDAFAPNSPFNVAPAAWYAPPAVISQPMGLWLFDRS